MPPVPSETDVINGAPSERPVLTIMVPVLNEEKSLIELHRQIAEVAEASQIDLEVIFVDDGSTDQSWNVIRDLNGEDPRVRGVRLRRNFGKAAALTAAIQQARADLLMMMDADLQDDPAELPAFLAKLSEGFDVVNGWKQRRLDPWHKVYPSKVFNWLVSRISGLRLHDHNCGLKLFRKEVATDLKLYGERHRFIAVLAHHRGFRVTELPVNHRPRIHGHSKYGVRRFLRGLLDLFTVSFLTSFGQRPQHLLGGIGLLFISLGFGGLTYLAVLWCLMNIISVLPPVPIGTRPLLAYSIASTLLGGQALSLGLLAELIVANTSRVEETFSVAESLPSSDCDN